MMLQRLDAEKMIFVAVKELRSTLMMTQTEIQKQSFLEDKVA